MTSDRKHATYLIDEPPLLVYPTLATLLGINKAAMIQQLHFLLNSAKTSKSLYNLVDGRWWVYNSYPQWQRDQFPWLNQSSIKRLFLEMEADAFVLSMQSVKNPSDRRKWYSIDYPVWEQYIATKLSGESVVRPSGQKKLVIGLKSSDQPSAQNEPVVGLKESNGSSAENEPVVGSKSSDDSTETPSETPTNTSTETPVAETTAPVLLEADGATEAGAVFSKDENQPENSFSQTEPQPAGQVVMIPPAPATAEQIGELLTLFSQNIRVITGPGSMHDFVVSMIRVYGYTAVRYGIDEAAKYNKRLPAYVERTARRKSEELTSHVAVGELLGDVG